MSSAPKFSGTPGEIYEQNMVPAVFARWSPDLVALARVGPGDRVLDVACGTGAVTRLLAERVGPSGRVVGLDFNPVMLGAAKVAVTSPNVDWLEADAAKMPLPDARFQAAICQQGLQFFPDKPTALREMRRVLAPGGRLALSVWRSTKQNPGARALEEALARRIGPEKAALPPFSLGDGEAIRSMVVAAGFREVKVQGEAKMSRFRSAEHMVRSVVGGAPTLIGVLAELGPNVLDEIIAEFAAATRDCVEDDGWSMPQASNLITAVV